MLEVETAMQPPPSQASPRRAQHPGLHGSDGGNHFLEEDRPILLSTQCSEPSVQEGVLKCQSQPQSHFCSAKSSHPSRPKLNSSSSKKSFMKIPTPTPTPVLSTVSEALVIIKLQWPMFLSVHYVLDTVLNPLHIFYYYLVTTF